MLKRVQHRFGMTGNNTGRIFREVMDKDGALQRLGRDEELLNELVKLFLRFRSR
jgi:hypothetical protein